jgi:hypothetical protein
MAVLAWREGGYEEKGDTVKWFRMILFEGGCQTSAPRQSS